MVIKLAPETEQKLKELAEATGQSVEDLVKSAIDREVRERGPKSLRDKMTPEEKADMLARIDEISNLPAEGDDEDDFAVEDHDKVIYRIDW